MAMALAKAKGLSGDRRRLRPRPRVRCGLLNVPRFRRASTAVLSLCLSRKIVMDWISLLTGRRILGRFGRFGVSEARARYQLHGE